MTYKIVGLASDEIVLRVRRVQATIRDVVIAQASAQTSEQMSSVSEETSSDTIYAIDQVSEDLVRRLFREAFSDTSIVLVGEGLREGGATFSVHCSPEDAAYCLIVDPIDGTRGVMYDKRMPVFSRAWLPTGVL